MSVREAQARIDSREFGEWIAFFGLDAESEGGDVAIIEDKPKAPKSGAEMGAIFRTFAQAHNAQVKRRGDNSNSGG